MTTACKTTDVDVLTEDDLSEVVGSTLSHLGLSFDELAEQAHKHHFDSIEARLAWLAIGELYQKV
ncbi:Uncharacterised protein [Mycobacteroides abscessus subsp. bolletii]|uniref:hypothetical protein n=1 Tax=Mycobacteroides abscessus TaxID=36809 RepID=UPI000927DDE8|nr:hypothetical protein [Mycobacteroides abscessus]SIJ76833.1 Uncharacterised protein [Mycobacteroides abscessus subsp. bolletii]